MKRFALPVLIVVLLAVFGAVAWIATGPHRSGVSHSTDSADAALAPGSELEAGAKDHAGELTAPDLDADARAAQLANGAASITGVHVTGHIRAPLGSPGATVDTGVEVFALARAATIEELFAAIDPRAVGEKDPETSPLVLARVRAESSAGDVRFDLALPKGTRKTFVIFAGRSWFMREALTVDLRGGRAAVALQAEPGAWITGTIDAPGDATALDGEVARLRPSQGGFGGFQGGGRGGRRTERRARITAKGFELRAVDSMSTYDLVLETKHFAAAQQPVGDIVAGRENGVRITLARGGAVSGVVKSADGTPIADATVEARLTDPQFGFNSRMVRTANSGADGTFALEAVLPGKIQVSATSKGWLDGDPAKVDVVDGVAISGVVVELSAGKSIAGLVTWKDGTPAAAADVTISFDPEASRAAAAIASALNNQAAARGNNGNGGGNARGNRGGNGGGRNGRQGGPDPKFTTDAQGRFSATGLSDGPFIVTAEALPVNERAAADQESKDLQKKRLHRGHVGAIQAGSIDVAVTLAPPVGVRGIVKDSSGAPIPDFVVLAQFSGQGNGGPFGGGGGGGGGNGRIREEEHDEQGRFFLVTAREGTWRISVSADDYAASDAIEVTIPRKSDDHDPIFSLVRAATVAGLVKSPQGAPVAGATVTITTPRSQQQPFGRGGGGGGNNQDDPKAQSDADGRFVLANLKPGKLTFIAESKQWARSPEVDLELASGQRADGTLLVVRDGGRITGEVFDAGRPAPTRTVQATEMTAFTQKTATTDAVGHFHMDHVEPGSWRITVMPSPLDAPTSAQGADAGGGGGGPGGFGGRGGMFGQMKSANVDVVDGEEAHVVIGAPPEDPVVVHGHVTHGNEPVSGVSISFAAPGAGFGPGGKQARTGPDGLYSLTLDKPGDYVVSVQTSGGGGGGGRGGFGRQNVLEYAETIPSRKDVALDFALPNGRISGRVLDTDGSPAVGARVSLRAQTQIAGTSFGGQMNELTTDEDGRYDVQSLRAGSYTVQAGGATVNALFSGQDATVSRELRAGVKIADGEWIKDCDFKLRKPANVEVLVVDDSAAPVSGATVFARDDAGRPVDRISTARSDSDGIAKYGGLAPGRYSFSARKDGLASGESGRVDVSEGGAGTIRITLTQGTLLYVKCVDADESTLRATVTVLDDGGREVSGLLGVGDMMQRFGRGTSSASSNGEQRTGPLAPGTYRVRATAADGRSMERSVTLAGQVDRHLTLSFTK